MMYEYYVLNQLRDLEEQKYLSLITRKQCISRNLPDHVRQSDVNHDLFEGFQYMVQLEERRLYL